MKTWMVDIVHSTLTFGVLAVFLTIASDHLGIAGGAGLGIAAAVVLVVVDRLFGKSATQVQRRHFDKYRTTIDGRILQYGDRFHCVREGLCEFRGLRFVIPGGVGYAIAIRESDGQMIEIYRVAECQSLKGKR